MLEYCAMPNLSEILASKQKLYLLATLKMWTFFCWFSELDMSSLHLLIKYPL